MRNDGHRKSSAPHTLRHFFAASKLEAAVLKEDAEYIADIVLQPLMNNLLLHIVDYQPQLITLNC